VAGPAVARPDGCWLDFDILSSKGRDMSEEVTALLREIRDQQRQALDLQREHMALYLKQLERVERINDRAEAIQGRAGKAAKFILWVAIPLVVVLLALMFRPYVERLLS
jgi:hypothetical protein